MLKLIAELTIKLNVSYFETHIGVYTNKNLPVK